MTLSVTGVGPGWRRPRRQPEILLLAFQRFFAHTEETDAQLKVLADATVALMVRVVRPLGDLITALPAGPEYPGRTAGPSFELF